MINDGLPSEMIAEIIQYLSFADLKSLRQTSRKFRDHVDFTNPEFKERIKPLEDCSSNSIFIIQDAVTPFITRLVKGYRKLRALQIPEPNVEWVTFTTGFLDINREILDALKTVKPPRRIWLNRKRHRLNRAQADLSIDLKPHTIDLGKLYDLSLEVSGDILRINILRAYHDLIFGLYTQFVSFSANTCAIFEARHKLYFVL